MIDYGAGNLYSVHKALEYVKKPANLSIQLVKKAEDLSTATHIILPGVGSFAGCMAGLSALPGMTAMLHRKVMQERTLFLGICVGMQMLFEMSEEHGHHQGLGWIKGRVRKMTATQGKDNLRIPHMGWNMLQIMQQDCPVLEGISTGDHAYFVHSYHCVPDSQKVVTATVEYGGAKLASIRQGNIFATQFHPEKSQQTGLRLLQNFLQLPAV
jgi:glutamine amidotransferase